MTTGKSISKTFNAIEGRHPDTLINNIPYWLPMYVKPWKDILDEYAVHPDDEILYRSLLELSYWYSGLLDFFRELHRGYK